jgi:HAMP domain-containing protein
MASNLTAQVRNIAEVTTAVASGDLSRKITVDVRGEILELKNTINTMTDTLRVFAEQVTTVAREVGTEGKLGGQAKVPGAAGTWRDLTDNVNQLANNLTGQVRAIADVATAVTEGDLTRSITVEAQGELLALKERVNQMIANLRETTEKNREQDWLKTNLAKFSAMMQGQKTLESVSRLIMSELTPLVGASHGAFFTVSDADDSLRLTSSYAYKERKHVSNRFTRGEGLVGQCALEKKPILLTRVRRTTSRSIRAWARLRRSTSWCCRSCSRARCVRWQSSRASSRSARFIASSWISCPRASASCST